MQCADGIWLPDSEAHLVKMIRQAPQVNGKGTYQYSKLQAALEIVRRRRCAIDVGMHVGLWSMHLAREFEWVVGFEPVAEHIECLHHNMVGFGNWEVHHCALGSRTGSVGMHQYPGSSGSTQVDNGGQGTVMHRLDDFTFDAVDFLKIDVEGYEFDVLQGAYQTIMRHKPVVVVEQKPMKNPIKVTYGRQQYQARDLLQSWGAKQLFEMNGDCCLTW